MRNYIIKNAIIINEGKKLNGDVLIKNGRIEKWVLREAFKDYLPESVLWRQKEQFSDGVGYSWIDSLKDLVSKEVSDHDLENASKIFSINTPRNKEEYYYRLIFSDHFSSDAAAKSVPSVPSVACSTPQALEWDEAFKNMNDPSGRSISNIHNKSYE
jgi:asparagine synthase (glutamine-hydrolysing)